MHYANRLTAAERARARHHAMCSAYYGCISELMLDSSAVIMTYVVLLGGGDMFSMLSSSMSGLAYVLLLIPLTGLNDILGLKRSVRIACQLGCAAYLLMAMAPFFGAWAPHVVIAGALAYSMTKPLYLNTWYPLLDNFLLPAERGPFFSVMRFYYMLGNALLFSGMGLLMGKQPPLWFLQVVIALAGLSTLGRSYHIQKLPVDPERKVAGRYALVSALRTSLRNGPLAGFSVYVCFVTLCSSSLLPLAFIYLKSRLGVPPNSVVTISGLAMSGTIVGYLVAGRLLRAVGTKWVQISCHLVFVLTSLGCFLSGRENALAVWQLTGMLILQGLAAACFSVCTSSEIMALARPGNQTMASAVCNTYIQAGAAVSRLGTSLVIGSCLLAESWVLGEVTVSRLQTLFLLFGCGLLFSLLLLILVPAVIPSHDDYYQP